MGRGALAILLCAAPLLVAAPAAAATPPERAALRAALQAAAPSSVSAAAVPRLPLPDLTPPALAASSRAELIRLARSTQPASLLVGLRSHSDKPAVEALLRRLGARPRLLAPIGVFAVRADSAARFVMALRHDPGVAFIERDHPLRVADPGDGPDPGHGNLPGTWAYGFVHAGQAIAAAGGGSGRKIAVIDTGADVRHPDLAGRLVQPYDTVFGGLDVRDLNGHGTFVAGLISAVGGNGIGGRGVAGSTQVLPIRASLDGAFTASDLVAGIEAALRSGADVLNLSVAGAGLSLSSARALDLAFLNNVLPVAASGNRGDMGNPIEFPAAAVGGLRGRPGIGLSVSAVDPNGRVPAFSNHNAFVSLAAPGAGLGACNGVLSTIPANGGTIWDDGSNCPRVFGSTGGARWAYGEGTSFAAPLAAGIAALVWEVEPKLASEQVADVLIRSASGSGWNEYRGAGILDGQAGAALARVYDTRAPKARGKARRRGRRKVAVRIKRSRDRSEPGHELAGDVSYALLVSRNRGRTFRFAAGPRRKPIRKRVRLRGRRRYLLIASVCDGNGNCDSKRLGSFRKKR